MDKKIFKKSKISVGVNLCGCLFGFPNIPIADYMNKLEKKIREIADAGASFILAWLFVPMTENPADTPAWRRNYTIVKPNGTRWTHNLNDAFFTEILLSFHKICRKFNVIPVYGLTGYTRVIKVFPVSASLKEGTLYSATGADFFKNVLKKLCNVLPDRNLIIEPCNEPHTLQVPDREKAIGINYAVAKFHAEIVDYGIRELELKEYNFQCNLEEGFNRETGIRAKCYGVLGFGHFRKKFNLLNHSLKYISDEKNHGSIRKTSVIICQHNIGCLDNIIGSHPVMGLHEMFTGLLKKDGKKYRRGFEIVGFSNDGFNANDGRLSGTELYENFLEVGKYLKGHDRTAIWYVHFAPYILTGGAKASHLHTIDLDLIDSDRVVKPAAEAYQELYGVYPDNYGKYPEQEKPVQPGQPVQPEIETDPEKQMEQKPKKYTWLWVLLAFLISLLIWIL